MAARSQIETVDIGRIERGVYGKAYFSIAASFDELSIGVGDSFPQVLVEAQ